MGFFFLQNKDTKEFLIWRLNPLVDIGPFLIDTKCMIKETRSHHLIVTDTLDIDFWQRPTKVFPRIVFEFSLRCELESIEWALKLFSKKTKTRNGKTLSHFDFVLPVVMDLESIYLESMSAKHLHVVRSYNISCYSCKSWNLNLIV